MEKLDTDDQDFTEMKKRTKKDKGQKYHSKLFYFLTIFAIFVSIGMIWHFSFNLQSSAQNSSSNNIGGKIIEFNFIINLLYL